MPMDCTYRLRIPHRAGQLATVAGRIAEHGGLIGDISTISVAKHEALREITVEVRDKAHAEELADGLGQLDGVTVSWFHDRAFIAHDGGKLDVVSKRPDPVQPGRARRLHARRGARVAGHRRVPRAGLALHDDRPQRGHRHQRHPRPGAGRHRPRPGDAGDGGQGALLRPAGRHQRGADPDRHQGRRRVRGHRRAHRSRVRRHPPGGHLHARLLRDRAAPDRRAAPAGDARRRARHRRGHLRGRDRRLPPGRHPPRRGRRRPDRPGRRRLRHRLADPRRGRARDRRRPQPGRPAQRARARHRDRRPGDGHGEDRRRRGHQRPPRPDQARAGASRPDRASR